MSTTTTHPRTDSRYWLKKVKPGTSGEYGVQIAYRGNRHRFPLATAKANEAAKKAAAIFADISTDGWDAALKKHKGSAEKAATLGVFLAEVFRVLQTAPSTRSDYENAIRRVYADIGGIKSDKTRFDYVNGGNAAWVAKIDALSLDTVTPAKFMKWRTRFVDQAKTEQEKVSRRRSANTFLARCKALFSEKNVLKGLEIALPDPLPFAGVENLRGAGVPQHNSKIDAAEIIEAAFSHFSAPQGEGERPDECKARGEALKVFILALFCGLTRQEIDGLQWSAIDFKTGKIAIRRSETARLKTQAREGEVAIDPHTLARLKELRKTANGPFVIESKNAPKSGTRYTRYRATVTYETLTRWLKDFEDDQGRKPLANVRKPLHELRKEAGAVIVQQFGIYAASKFLRHSNIATTARFYADDTRTITTGLGAFITPENVQPISKAGNE
ncbi:MAG: site-specific integrase [Akkermansiaceae bacterium]|nr:site-specific integrase [Akkermansiaceae bacterium]